MNSTIMGFGIAGNFAHHLEQAGESADFVDVVVDEADAPKGIFPTFIPNSDTFLNVYPFSSKRIQSLEDANIQMEPEVALLCDVTYENGKVKTLTPTHFGAYNDCSIRVEGAKKISHKKNWGIDSKGISKTLLPIDSFKPGSIMDHYSLTSFIKRDGKLIQYGENSELLGYSYFYDKLINWIISKLNTQKDTGPLEDLLSLIKKADYPKQLLISIGATRYTEFGETNYLKKGDILYVIVYDHTKHSHEQIKQMIEDEDFAQEDISVLQKTVY